MKKGGQIILTAGVEIPPSHGEILEVDFKAAGIKKKEMALAALYLLAQHGDPITAEMLEEALKQTFQGKMLEEARLVMKKTAAISI
jgi:inorganic pyrophosphatase/exopolyphosphatase